MRSVSKQANIKERGKVGTNLEIFYSRTFNYCGLTTLTTVCERHTERSVSPPDDDERMMGNPRDLASAPSP